MAAQFAPDAARTAAAAAALDRHLLDSLTHLAEACEAAQLAVDRRGIARLAQMIAAGQGVHPAHYALHFELLDAIAAEDEPAIAERFAMLADLGASKPIVALDESALAGVYRHAIDADAQRRLSLTPVPAACIGPAGGQIADARRLLQRIVPELAAEVHSLVRQIILACDAPNAAHPFYGGSSFFLWGGIFFNPLRHASAYEAAETLVHEGAHTLLTALAREQPLVLNPRAARYRAPIRQDPRPMEGIYHATFVLARTCLLHRAAAASADLPQVLREQAESVAKQDSRYFMDGFATVMAEAEMSALGRALIEDAARFVEDGA